MTSAALLRSFPDIDFKAGKSFVWSPRQRTVIYDTARIDTDEGIMVLLHEIGHARLNHISFELDIELLNMEVEAWAEARQFAQQLGAILDEGYIEKCLETYRLWLYKRSKCPVCGNTSLQADRTSYRCFNCQAGWQVAQSRSVQPRRMRCISQIKV